MFDELEVKLIEEFVSNFSLSRPGHYIVPDHIIKLCAEEFVQDGRMPSLFIYESGLHMSWDYNCEYNRDNYRQDAVKYETVQLFRDDNTEEHFRWFFKECTKDVLSALEFFSDKIS